jgi:hypothetical protein
MTTTLCMSVPQGIHVLSPDGTRRFIAESDLLWGISTRYVRPPTAHRVAKFYGVASKSVRVVATLKELRKA